MSPNDFGPPPTSKIGFHAYLRSRKYHFGRGRDSSWTFIARALGDPELPDVTTWRQFRQYLEGHWAEPDLEAAKVVWGSYQRNAPRVSRAAGERLLEDIAYAV